MQGIVKALCLSERRGTAKVPVNKVTLVAQYGIEGDAHAGKWHRQVSLLSAEKVQAFNEKAGETIAVDGTFGENILVSGIELSALPVGTILRSGEIVLKVSQIGKLCHSHCEIFHRVGDCIMPREGIFATVEVGGVLKVGDVLTVELPSGNEQLTAAVITLSDKGSRGERVDTSGPRAAEMLQAAGYDVVEEIILPDVQPRIEAALKRLADSRQVNLIITTGGTGLAPTDVTPEATLAVATRLAPGFAEAIRAESLKITRHAMLSRGVSVIRNRTLIINLPGSTKAVAESLEVVLPVLEHGLRLLAGRVEDCGR